MLSIALAVPFLSAVCFLWSQKYLLHLLLLAIPTQRSISKGSFVPDETFAQVHARVLSQIKGDGERKLQILDVSTGSCNSLFKHGWMQLDAEYTAIDLSSTMLLKGQELMGERGVAVDLVLGDAMNLPFQSGFFDIVLNYGAINGMTDPAKAVSEMLRVGKPGAHILMLDEQMYDNASPVEKDYFTKVLSSHNVIHHCPVEAMALTAVDVRVVQIYEFYYLCTARKLTAEASV